MKASKLRQNQTELKEAYAAEPNSAVQTLSAVGIVDPENLACKLQHPTFLSPAGLHESSGGDGTFACPVEIMLAGLVSCAGVTFAAVANAMRLEIVSCTITAKGTLDFRGTLAVDRDAPVGLTDIELDFSLEGSVAKEKIEKLLELTLRYCVVHETLQNPPKIRVTHTAV